MKTYPNFTHSLHLLSLSDKDFVGFHPRKMFSFNWPRERIVGRIVCLFLSCTFWRLCRCLSSLARSRVDLKSPCNSTRATFQSGTKLCLNSSERPESQESTDGLCHDLMMVTQHPHQIMINNNKIMFN